MRGMPSERLQIVMPTGLASVMQWASWLPQPDSLWLNGNPSHLSSPMKNPLQPSLSEATIERFLSASSLNRDRASPFSADVHMHHQNDVPEGSTKSDWRSIEEAEVVARLHALADAGPNKPVPWKGAGSHLKQQQLQQPLQPPIHHVWAAASSHPLNPPAPSSEGIAPSSQQALDHILGRLKTPAPAHPRPGAHHLYRSRDASPGEDLSMESSAASADKLEEQLHSLQGLLQREHFARSAEAFALPRNPAGKSSPGRAAAAAAVHQSQALSEHLYRSLAPAETPGALSLRDSAADARPHPHAHPLQRSARRLPKAHSVPDATAMAAFVDLHSLLDAHAHTGRPEGGALSGGGGSGGVEAAARRDSWREAGRPATALDQFSLGEAYCSSSMEGGSPVRLPPPHQQLQAKAMPGLMSPDKRPRLPAQGLQHHHHQQQQPQPSSPLRGSPDRSHGGGLRRGGGMKEVGKKSNMQGSAYLGQALNIHSSLHCSSPLGSGAASLMTAGSSPASSSDGYRPGGAASAAAVGGSELSLMELLSSRLRQLQQREADMDWLEREARRKGPLAKSQSLPVVTGGGPSGAELLERLRLAHVPSAPADVFWGLHDPSAEGQALPAWQGQQQRPAPTAQERQKTDAHPHNHHCQQQQQRTAGVAGEAAAELTNVLLASVVWEKQQQQLLQEQEQQQHRHRRASPASAGAGADSRTPQDLLGSHLAKAAATSAAGAGRGIEKMDCSDDGAALDLSLRL